MIIYKNTLCQHCHILLRGYSRPPGAKIHKKRNLRIQGRMQFFEKNVTEGFKSGFDTAIVKSAKNAADPAKNHGFRKYLVL